MHQTSMSLAGSGDRSGERIPNETTMPLAAVTCDMDNSN